jgi:hypothetical protein
VRPAASRPPPLAVIPSATGELEVEARTLIANYQRAVYVNGQVAAFFIANVPIRVLYPLLVSDLLHNQRTQLESY